MNRMEQRLQACKQEGKKAFVTYMTAGLPDMEGCKKLIQTQEAAGIDAIELGIPFSDPVADGPVIQAASYKSICQGTNLKGVFEMVSQVRTEGCEVPLIFMMYFNTILYYGIEKFVEKCIEVGVDGVIVPDLPFEEQKQFTDVLNAHEHAPIMIQLLTPMSKQRIPMILENARGFVYCISSMGVTGQAADFHKDIRAYLKEVKSQSNIPVMMGFGIRTAKDVDGVHDLVDGCIVGSHFINMMEESGYDMNVAKTYIETFKQELNA